jgi:hypothetical protein
LCKVLTSRSSEFNSGSLAVTCFGSTSNNDSKLCSSTILKSLVLYSYLRGPPFYLIL